jgi:hypothetical protein
MPAPIKQHRGAAALSLIPLKEFGLNNISGDINLNFSGLDAFKV